MFLVQAVDRVLAHVTGDFIGLIDLGLFKKLKIPVESSRKWVGVID